MKLVADSGGWTIGPDVAEAPAVAVLEVSGAVLAWTIDDPTGAAATVAIGANGADAKDPVAAQAQRQRLGDFARARSSSLRSWPPKWLSK